MFQKNKKILVPFIIAAALVIAALLWNVEEKKKIPEKDVVIIYTNDAVLFPGGAIRSQRLADCRRFHRHGTGRRDPGNPAREIVLRRFIRSLPPDPGLEPVFSA